MLIPLGIIASAGVSAGSFDLLETQVLTGSAASVTFSSLSTYASTYKHLQIRMTARSDRAGTNESHFYLRFNADSGANYRHHYLTGTGSTVASGDPTSSFPNGVFSFFGVTAATSATNNFGASVLDILDPFETTKNKTVRILNGSTDLNRIALGSGAWFNTSATSSLAIHSVYGNFITGSRFSLYGIKGA